MDIFVLGLSLDIRQSWDWDQLEMSLGLSLDIETKQTKILGLSLDIETTKEKVSVSVSTMRPWLQKIGSRSWDSQLSLADLCLTQVYIRF